MAHLGSGPRIHREMTTLVVAGFGALAAVLALNATLVVTIIARPAFAAAAELIPVLALAFVAHVFYIAAHEPGHRGGGGTGVPATLHGAAHAAARWRGRTKLQSPDADEPSDDGGSAWCGSGASAGRQPCSDAFIHGKERIS